MTAQQVIHPCSVHADQHCQNDCPYRVSAVTLAQGYARWRDAIIGRMIVEHASDLSDAEIARTLGPCVCGPRLIAVAKAMRECGTLAASDVTPPPDEDHKHG